MNSIIAHIRVAPAVLICRLFSACFFLLAALLPMTSGAVGDDSVETLRGLVEKWVTLRSEIAGERRSWREQSHLIAEQINLLELEKKRLTDEISAYEMEESVTEDPQLRARLESADAILEGLIPAVEAAEAWLLGVEKAVPESLAPEFRGQFARIPRNRHQSVVMRVEERLQVALGLLAGVESLSGKFHVARELLPFEGGRREMLALYAGLARAFAVTPDGKHSAIGEPGPEGWTWKERPGIGKSLLNAIGVFEEQRPAEYVDLPMKVSDLR